MLKNLPDEYHVTNGKLIVHQIQNPKFYVIRSKSPLVFFDNIRSNITRYVKGSAWRYSRSYVEVTTPQVYEDSCFTNFSEKLPDSTYITINYLMLK